MVQNPVHHTIFLGFWSQWEKSFLNRITWLLLNASSFVEAVWDGQMLPIKQTTPKDHWDHPMTAGELVYFRNAHYAHIVTYEEHLRFHRLNKYKRIGRD